MSIISYAYVVHPESPRCLLENRRHPMAVCRVGVVTCGTEATAATQEGGAREELGGDAHREAQRLGEAEHDRCVLASFTARRKSDCPRRGRHR
jgi:hypothetical protein